jgi:hypothetical protein
VVTARGAAWTPPHARFFRKRLALRRHIPKPALALTEAEPSALEETDADAAI